MKASRYYVMMMDIIGSAKMNGRDKLTHRLITSIEKVNQSYGQDLFAPFEITRGDEFVAISTKINSLYDIIGTFQEKISPEEFRTVVVYGELNAGLQSKQSSIIDGPAFQHADSMMRSLKKSSMTFAMDTGHKEWDRIAQAALNLLLWRWNGFTLFQQKIIRLYQKFRNQNRVGKQINRSQQQVQATLESCRWELIEEAEKSIRDTLAIIDEKTDHSDT